MSPIGHIICEFGDFEDGGMDLSILLLLRRADLIWFEAMAALSSDRKAPWKVRGHW